jgi:hypothetical protein
VDLYRRHYSGRWIHDKPNLPKTMRLTLILFFACLSTVLIAQKDNYWLLDNNGNNEVGTITLDPRGAIEYSTTYKVQGTHGLWNNASYEWVVTSAKIDATSGALSIVGSARRGSTTGYRTIISSRTITDKKGISLDMDAANARLRFTQDAGASEGSAFTAVNSIPNAAFFHWAVVIPDVTQNVVRLYINGVRDKTDSIGHAGSGFNDSIAVSALRDGSYTASGGIDNLQTYGRALTDAEVLDLYNHRADAYYLPATPDAAPTPNTANRLIYYSIFFSPAITPNFPLPVITVDYTRGLDGRLSHDQYMVTYNGANVGDVVGTIDPWYVTDYLTVGTQKYYLTDTEGGIYAADSITGLVTIASRTGLAPGIDTLRFRTTLGAVTDSFNIFVTIRDSVDCYFIDPTDGSAPYLGTELNPYNSWSQVTFAPGKTYLQKRGTTYSQSTSIIIPKLNTSVGSEIILAAYGSSVNRPIITNGITIHGFTVRCDYTWIFEYNFRYNKEAISIQSLDHIVEYCKFSDITCYSNKAYGGQIYIKKPDNILAPPYYWYDHHFEFYDLVISDDKAGGTTEQYGIKPEGGSCYFRNVWSYNNVSDGISIPYQSQKITIVGLLAYGNGNYQIEMSGPNHELSQSYLVGGQSPIVVMDKNSEHSSIHHCEIVGGTVMGGIYLYGAATNSYIGRPVVYGRYITIEDNIIRNSTGSISGGIQICTGMNHLTIRRNTFYGHVNGIRIGFVGLVADSLRDIDISYNTFHTNTTRDVSIAAGSNITLYNNTGTGAINATGGTGTIMNSFYGSISASGFSLLNNIDVDNITTSDYFTDYANGIFTLISTAIGAIDQAVDWGQDADSQGNSMSGTGWDIGANEYQP